MPPKKKAAANVDENEVLAQLEKMSIKDKKKGGPGGGGAGGGSGSGGGGGRGPSNAGNAAHVMNIGKNVNNNHFHAAPAAGAAGLCQAFNQSGSKCHNPRHKTFGHHILCSTHHTELTGLKKKGKPFEDRLQKI